jgi:hypothetical protein
MFGESRHWSDEIVRESDCRQPWRRQRERERRIALLNAILRPYHVTVADWRGEKLLAQGPSGRCELAETGGDLWQKAQVAAGRLLDPLDTRFSGGAGCSLKRDNCRYSF